MNLSKFLTTINGKKDIESRFKEVVFLAERREHPRHAVELPVDYSNMDGKERWGIAGDASEGGLLVYLHESIEKGALLKIEMFFIRASELNTIKAIAKVVWSESAANKSWGKYRHGLAFQAFHNGSLGRLKNLLEDTGEAQA